MVIVVVRTLILYTLVIVALRLMGKKEIGQLQPFELVVILMISELAAIPSENIGIPLLAGVIPILVLLLTSVTLSFLSMKSYHARKVLCGTPSILIERGKILELELKKNRFNLSDLLEELRLKNVPNIADVEFAILETNGQVSIVPKSQKRPTTPEDFMIKTSFEGIPLNLILDGRIVEHNMQKINKDRYWLENEIKKFNLNKIEDVLLASIDSSGNLFVQGKEQKNRAGK